MDATTPRCGRLCALCQQRYGSGLRDHIAASVRQWMPPPHAPIADNLLTPPLFPLLSQDVLRARRMLLDRSSSGADPDVRRGLDLFLEDLTTQRGARQPPTSMTLLCVCAFCTQFLPPMYQEDKLVDDLRHQLLATGVNAHGASTVRRRGSSLVIQHQFPRSRSSSSRTPRPPSLPPSSSPSDESAPQSTHPPHTYRLLTNEITRVLHVDASAVHGATGDHDGLIASDVMKNLRHRERRQTVTILAARHAKHEARLRWLHETFPRREDLDAHSSDIHAATTEKTNIVRAVSTACSDGAASLYTGVVLAPPTTTTTTTTASKSRSKIVVSKSGRHFKTELLFPALGK